MEKDISLFHKDRSSSDGYSHRCAECSIEQQKKPNIVASRKKSYFKNIDKFRERTRIWEKTIRGKYCKYRKGALKRNLLFNLSEEEFSKYWKKPCSYCGSNIETIGIDRIDNNLGYDINNIISCCELCNWMKRDMTQQEFYNRCNKIVKQWNPGKQQEWKDRKTFKVK
jgi:hypothetical protein